MDVRIVLCMFGGSQSLRFDGGVHATQLYTKYEAVTLVIIQAYEGVGSFQQPYSRLQKVGIWIWPVLCWFYLRFRFWEKWSYSNFLASTLYLDGFMTLCCSCLPKTLDVRLDPPPLAWQSVLIHPDLLKPLNEVRFLKSCRDSNCDLRNIP